MTTDDPALAQTTASGIDEGGPAERRDTLPADEGTVPTGRAAERLAHADRARYEIAGELGRGGLGRVLRARDVHLGRRVAVKEMLGGGPDAERRFVREALITARLEHPSIVPVHDAARGDDGAPFYTMKLVGGRPLAEVMAEAKTTSERLALVPRLLAVADAIAYAHAERVIHRDLKPANVLCGEFGETVVIDWGLAKDLSGEVSEEIRPAQGGSALRPPGADQTIDGAILGTPAYMAPEQAAAEDVDERADVYAIGAMLYELLAGTTAHAGGTLDEVLRRVIAGDLPPLATRAPEVPADLAAIVGKAMARNKDDRYRDARALADDLRRYVTGQLVAVYEYGRWEKLKRWIAKNRGAVAVGAIATAILVIVAVVAIRRIVAERDTANTMRAAAEARAREASEAEAAAAERSDELLVTEARATVETDPTRAIAILAGLPAGSSRWSAARVIAADAASRGIADELIGHVASTEAVALDEHGAHVASLGPDGIRVWDRGAHTVRTIALPDPCGGASDCVFGLWQLMLSRDGRWLVAGGGAATRWDLDTPSAPARTFAGAPVALLDDGRVATSTADGLAIDGKPALPGPLAATVAAGGTIAVIDSAGVRVSRDGPALPTWSGPIDPSRVAIAADGSELAWWGKGRLYTWRAAGDPPVSYPVADLHALAIGKGAIAWIDAIGVAWLVRTPALDLRHTTAPAIGVIASLTPTADPDTFIAIGDRGVALVHGNGTEEIVDGERRAWGIGVSGDGASFAAAGAPAVPVWKLPPSAQSVARAPRKPTPPGASSAGAAATVVMVTHAGQPSLVIDWTESPVERWHRDGASLVRDGEVPVPSFSDLSMSSKGDVLFVDDQGAATYAAGAVHRLAPASLGWFGPDDAAYTIDDDRAIRRWNVDGTGGAQVCPASTTGWHGVELSGDGGTVGDASGAQIVRCRLDGSATLSPLPGGPLDPWAFDDDGDEVGGWDATAKALVLIDSSGRRTFPIAQPPTSIWMSPDDRWLVAVAADSGFTIVDLQSGATRHVDEARGMRDQLDWLPGDGAVLSGARSIIVVDLPSGATRQIALGLPPGNLATDPDGSIIAAVADRVMLWKDDLPHDPDALRAWVEAATDARVDAGGELTTAAPYRGR